MKFGDYIRERRTELGWTQPEAAIKAGIEQSYLSKLENGRSTPSADVYQRLCEAYAIKSAALYAAIDDEAIQELMDIEQIRALSAAAAQKDRTAEQAWRAASVIAFGFGAGLLGAAIFVPGEEQRFVYQSTGVVLEGETLDVFSDIDDAGPELLARVETQTRSQVSYQGPSFIENVEGGRRVWRLSGGETQAVNQWARWLLIPGLTFLFSGAAGLFSAWRRP